MTTLTCPKWPIFGPFWGSFWDPLFEGSGQAIGGYRAIWAQGVSKRGSKSGPKSGQKWCFFMDRGVFWGTPFFRVFWHFNGIFPGITFFHFYFLSKNGHFCVSSAEPLFWLFFGTFHVRPHHWRLCKYTVKSGSKTVIFGSFLGHFWPLLDTIFRVFAESSVNHSLDIWLVKKG